ncbi:hypothetical protein E2562_038215 [Oryza meyeriana var. granulata]|uniref:Uncharacterized protein n=1 Tax=Oryza meyeriana var. granulata TaxID=110450 RepID=A0A6G1EU82_9ORYZ|nr:hypothetical protein E2562_038215 [Oryza meyeriana var. granulata]
MHKVASIIGGVWDRGIMASVATAPVLQELALARPARVRETQRCARVDKIVASSPTLPMLWSKLVSGAWEGACGISGGTSPMLIGNGVAPWGKGRL